jgi:uncharacterized phiE125 gp8 family phage protein
MKALLITPPLAEPITLAEIKLQGIIDSETFDGNLTISQSLPYGSYATQDNYTTHVGAWIDVLGKEAEVLLHCGTNEATGTNDTKIQESDDTVIFNDYINGAFAQVTTASDNTDYKKAYTGTKRYIRTVSKVLLAACGFGTSVLVKSSVNTEDTLLTSYIKTAREIFERRTRRQIMTATWDYYLDSWPKGNSFKLPFGNLVSVSSIKYKDTAGVEYALTESTDYIVEANGNQCGKIVLPYGVSWPSENLYPSNPITIRFVCGYASALVVPYSIKTAIAMIVLDLHENRESQIISNSAANYTLNPTAETMMYSSILWEIF